MNANISTPLQKIPKSKKDRNWKVNNMKYYNGFAFGTTTQSHNTAIEKLFRIASGVIDMTEYSHIQNPYHLEGEQFKKYPDKLRRYDILSPLFLKALRRFLDRPFEPVVYTRNSNFDNEKQQAEKALIEESLQRKFINSLIATGQIQEQDQVEELSPDIIKQKVSSMKDMDTISGQTILDYMLDKDHIQQKYMMEFYHLLCTNRCFSYADVRNDNVIRYTVNPMIIDVHGGNNDKFIEDYAVIRVRYRFTFEEIVDIFQGEDLSEYPDFFEYLENYNSNFKLGNYSTSHFDEYRLNRHGLPATNTGINSMHRFIDVNHIQWSSFRKVHFIPNGEELIEVDEDYIGDDIVYSEWKEEIREGYIIANKYYVGGDCIENPRYDFNNPFKAKKNYTGVIFMHDLIQQLSIPEKVIQYQEAYDVIKFKIQYTINKNKDKIATIPMSLLRMGGLQSDSASKTINHTFGDDEELDVKALMNERGRSRNNPIAENLYYADTTQILFLDDSDPQKALAAASLLKSIDLSLGNYIQWLIQYAQNIKAEAEDVFGFNRYISGDIGNRESVQNVQAGLQQSTAIIDLYYAEFENYQANDLQRLIDLSRYAFKKGRNLIFTRNNTEVVKLQVPDNFQHLSYGIFVRNSSKTKEILDTLKAQAGQFLQNGMSHSVFSKMISQSHNYASIIQEIETKEAEIVQQEQAKDQSNRDAMIEVQRMKSETEDKKLQMEKYKVDVNAQIEMNKQILELQASDISTNKGEGVLEIAKLGNDNLTMLQSNAIKLKDIQTKKEIATQNNNTKKYVADKQEVVAKVNK